MKPTSPSPGYGGHCPLDELDQFHYVYVLRCSDDRFYTGATCDLNDRIHRHHQAWVPAATNAPRLLELLTFFAFHLPTDK